MRIFKKFYLAFIVFTVCSFQLFAQVGWDDAWDNVSITNINREEAHTLAIPFATERDVQSKSIEESPFYKSLNGTWKFNWAKDPDAKPIGFEASEYNVTTWDDIQVPSVWQVYGIRNNKNWDKPLYVNTSYPFTYSKTYSVMASRPADWTYNDNMKNPVGSYRRDFTIPASWDGRDVYVRLNGAGPGYYLWVNGHRVGYAEDSYLPSEFNITDYLKTGNNVIAVQVYRFTSGSFLECQDFWRFSGINRDVFLWSAPKAQIRDYFFTTDLDSQYKDAVVTLDVKLAGKELTASSLVAKIMDGATVIAEKTITPTVGINTVTMNVSNPKKWSAETPNQYDLVLTLKSGEKVMDIRGSKVGFREVGIGSKGELLINGKRMVFHGVNRHEHSEINGRTMSKEEIEADIKTMKSLNINAIRTSHYPASPYFYDLCDKYGMYVLAEANVESHGNMGLSSVEEFRKPMVERNENHVKWMRNHACIFMWSYGNESGGGNNFESVENAIKELDKTRLTHYQGNSQWSDVSSSMYGGYNDIKNIGESRLNEANPRPHIQCENSHAMGNSMGNVREYFDLYEKYPSLTGEFIWDWKDQSLKLPIVNKPGESYWAYGGDFGDKPNDNNFCTNGLVFADYSKSSKSYNTKKIYQPIDFYLKEDGITFLLKSKLAFKSTSDLDVFYTIMEDGKELKTHKLGVILEPGEMKEVSIEGLPTSTKPDAEYFVRFNVYQRNATWWSAPNYEVASEQLQLKQAEKPIYVLPTNGSLSVEENGDKINVTGADFSAAFSKSKGTLDSYVLNGKDLIDEPIELNVFRLPTDNDKAQTSSWDNMGIRKLTVNPGTWNVKETQNAVDLNIVNVYTANAAHSFITQMGFKVLKDGTIIVNTTVDPKNKGAIIPKIGFRLGMPAAFEKFTWFGRGPWSSYVDRKESCFEGVYNSTVTEQWEDFVLPQETGNKEDVRWMSIRDNDGTGFLFVTPEKMSASATHFKPEDLYVNRNNRIKHPYQVPFSENTIVSLNAQMRGLGNASCGPDVMPQYELKADYTIFSFMIIPVKSQLSNDDLSVKARVSNPVCSPVKIERDNDAKIQMTTTIGDAQIYYSINDGDYMLYDKPFVLVPASTIKAFCKSPGYFDSMIVSVDFSFFVDKATWSIVSFSSQHAGDEAYKAIDGDVSTQWHTPWGVNEPTHPHEIVVDMKETYQIESFLYQGRSDGDNGRIREYEIYFSNNPETWGNPAAKGEFLNSSNNQKVNISTKPNARYMKLISKSAFHNNPWTSVVEMGIEASAILDPASDSPK